jgi:uncharacterized membrane protein YphA (DoxX/SURF4 family)
MIAGHTKSSNSRNKNTIGSEVVRMCYHPSENPIIRFILQAIQQEGAYLLPLRLFIGIGWIRAGLEKWLEPSWHDGQALASFLEVHVQGGQIVFPGYQHLVQSLFEPNALALSLIIMISQFLVGIAILTGTFTNLALFGGLFMNINFILIGEVTPSAFYVMIQVVLLVSNIGAILGLDHFLAKNIGFCFLVAKPSFKKTHSRLEKVFMLIIIGMSLATAIAFLPSIESFDPSSVDDPAMISFVLSLFTAAFFLITLLRSHLSSLMHLTYQDGLQSQEKEFSLES